MNLEKIVKERLENSYTMGEVEKLLGVSRVWVQKRIDGKEFDTFKYGNVTRVKRESIEHYLKESGVLD